jgi:hypothetical protein
VVVDCSRRSQKQAMEILQLLSRTLNGNGGGPPMKIIGTLIIMSVLVVGCGTVQDTIYLQNVQVQGSESQPPIHVTTKSTGSKSVYLAPHISINSNTSLSGSLSPQYSGQVPTTLPAFQRRGLNWSLPSVQFGLDLDCGLSDNMALMLGGGQSVVNDRSLWDGYAGIGFFERDKNSAIRADLGIQVQEISYDAATVVERTTTPLWGNPYTERCFFLDTDKETHLNFFAAGTFNSIHDDWLVNPFCQAGFSTQKLTNFSPRNSRVESGLGTYIRTDLRAESSAFWLFAVPGVYFNVGQSNRLLLGVRISDQVGIENANPSVLFSPVLQFDWKL